MLCYSQFNRTNESAIQATVTKFRIKFTLLDIRPPTHLEMCEMKKISQLYRPVLMMATNQLSIRRLSQQLGQKHLGVKPQRSIFVE